MLCFRGYYVVVVPLKKQRGGKFLNPWEEPDQMNLDEVSHAAARDYTNKKLNNGHNKDLIIRKY